MTTGLCLVSSIQVRPNRQRQEFDPGSLSELVNSISAFGLLHPPVVETDAAGVIHLLVGERRLRAIKRIHELGLSFSFAGQPVPKGHIPVTQLPSLDELERKEIELQENIQREDLTWQEKITADAELVELRRLQAAAAGKAEPSLRFIATELGMDPSSSGNLSTSLKVAAMLGDPEVAAAKSVNEAQKIVERKIREDYHRQLTAEMQGKQTTDTLSVYNQDGIQYLNANLGKFSCIIMDPPYGVGADSMGTQGNRQGRDFDDSAETFGLLITRFAQATFCGAKDEAHLYCFTSPDMFQFVRDTFQIHGWSVWPRPLIWAKNSGVLPVPDGGPRYTYETILFARKGGKKTTRVANDVLFYQLAEKTLHPDAKPVELYRDLLSRSCVPGDSVCDPCAGSGPVLDAGKALNLFVTAVEKSPLYFGGLLTRMEKMK